ncbi:MAG: spore coat protein U domain-containing protein [Bdellovibrionales bacterium]
MNKSQLSKIILCGIFSLVLFHKSAQAACGLSFTSNAININWTINFTYIAVQLQIAKTGPDACDYGLGFSKGGGASYVSRQGTVASSLIRYQLYKDNGLTQVLKAVPDITSADEAVQGGFQAGSNMTQTVNYYFEIPYNLAVTPSLVAAGVYTDSFVISLYEGSDPLAFVTAVDTASVNVSITVPTMIALSLIDSGGGFQEGSTMRTVNFGTLAEGQASSMDFRARTNAGFNVTFSSANNGFMKHTNPAKNSLVPYSFYVNGVLLDLSNSFAVPVSGVTASGQTSLSGLAYPIRVVVGNVSSGGKIGGPHSDSITITATTTE